MESTDPKDDAHIGQKPPPATPKWDPAQNGTIWMQGWRGQPETGEIEAQNLKTEKGSSRRREELGKFQFAQRRSLLKRLYMRDETSIDDGDKTNRDVNGLKVFPNARPWPR